MDITISPGETLVIKVAGTDAKVTISTDEGYLTAAMEAPRHIGPKGVRTHTSCSLLLRKQQEE